MIYPHKRLAAWLLAAVMTVSLLPFEVRAGEALTVQPLTGMEELVSGQYVLLSPSGDAPGILEEGTLIPAQPVLEENTLTHSEGVLWQLEVTEGGVLLTDPAGTPIVPGEDEEAGLSIGDNFWNVSCSEGYFTFSAFVGETEVYLARCEGLGFRVCRLFRMQEVYDARFILYRVENSEDPPAAEEPSQPPTDPAEEPQLTEESQPTEEPQPAEEPQLPAGPQIYFGLLHSHTADSSGTGTVEDAFSYARETAGLDFLAVTDHSSGFDGAENGSLSTDGAAVSEVWKRGREAAAAASGETFLALYGFEMDWQNGLGHIGTYFTPGFQSREQEAFSDPAAALSNYYAALAAVPGAVGQFNHPQPYYGDFEAFSHYSMEADSAMQLLEVFSEGERLPDAYERCLDAGWHVAPTASQNNHNGLWGDEDSSRTAVYADDLTEQSFADALRSRRVYATEDSDLWILWQLEGNLFGSILPRQDVGETVTLTASITDPTDAAVGTVEVIADGEPVARQEISEATGELTLELPADHQYYYLKVTQPDGDLAVTAPVWIRQIRTPSVTAFTSDTPLAVQSRPFRVRVEVRNPDPNPFTVEEVSFFLGTERIGAVSEPASVPGNSSAVYEMALTCAAAGTAEIRVLIRGTLAGTPAQCEATLALSFLTDDLVTTLVADGSHGNLPDLTELETLAARHRMVLVKASELTAEIMSTCDLLLIPAPDKIFDKDYVNLIGAYLSSGRSLILCGQADRYNPNGSGRLNDLLQALDLTARFRDDTAYDPANNGGQPDHLITDRYNPSDPLVSGIRKTWQQSGGCTVDPGDGIWLVKGMSTAFSVDGDEDGTGILDQTFTETVEGTDRTYDLVTAPGEAVLLAREETAFGGSVFLSGGLFAAGEVLDIGGENPWDAPNGNGSLLEAILGIPRESVPLSTAAQAKAAGDGETVRIRAYVTAGTAVEGNRFPDSIYVQDETGGLLVLDFTAGGISLGAPLELYLLREGDVFRLLHWQTLEEDAFLYQPKVLVLPDALDFDRFGHLLVQVEGRVLERTLTEDGKGVSAFTLEDRDGNRMTVCIEDFIRSASTGENTLADTVIVGSWVRSAGFVYRTDGQTVLRVRNCDEVIAVRETGKTYRVVKGEYSVWIRKDGGSIYMEVEGPASEFLGIEVDGELISQSAYQTVDRGKLVFRFWPRYLRTLELGSHSVVFKFRDGEAKATLVVWNHADNPYTGDLIGLHFGLMLLSGGLLLKKRRR